MSEIFAMPRRVLTHSMFLGIKQQSHKRHGLIIVFGSDLKRSVCDLDYSPFGWSSDNLNNKITSLWWHKADHAIDYYPSRRILCRWHFNKQIGGMSSSTWLISEEPFMSFSCVAVYVSMPLCVIYSLSANPCVLWDTCWAQYKNTIH